MREPAVTIVLGFTMPSQEILDSCDLGKLPSGPRILSQLTSMIRKPDVDISEIATLFHADSALTARAVAVCNSPFYSRGFAITDIRDAILHLGLKEVSRIVQTVILTDFKKYPTHLYTNVADHFWERSLHTAIVIDDISGGNPTAYTAGIMHLVGVWVLCSIFPAGYLSIGERELDLQAQLEQHRLGVNFARAGGRAMTAWGFEPEICGAVLWQLAPSAAELADQRALALLLNRAVAITDWHYGVRNEHTLIRSDLTINDVEDCNQRALERVAKIGFGG
jgi:HD-like signal output (HDOD) protein